MFNKIKEKYGKLDILINNAGRTFNTQFKDITEETIARDINTKFNICNSMFKICYRFNE